MDHRIKKEISQNIGEIRVEDQESDFCVFKRSQQDREFKDPSQFSTEIRELSKTKAHFLQVISTALYWDNTIIFLS